VSGDRKTKRPEGYYGKEQRAARAAAFAERKAAAAAKREAREADRARASAALRPLVAFARRQLAALPPRPQVDTNMIAAARKRSNKMRQRKLLERDRDIIDVRKPGAPPVPPTPEQAVHADYVEEKIFDRLPGGRMVLMGRAYRRRARFETIDGLTADQLKALRAYRAAFDQSETSEMKCALDIRVGGPGGSEAALAHIENRAFAGDAVRRLEVRVMAGLLPTLRAVALLDKEFKTIAIERFGSREVERIDTTVRRPTVTTSIEPKSGRHRQIVRDEFLAAATQLAAAVKALQPVKAPSPVMPTDATTPLVPVDPAYMDEQGRMRPFDEVREIILDRFNGADQDGVDDTVPGPAV
jgi:hypothetical protein